MAVMKVRCARCGENVVLQVKQYIVNNAIAWSEAYSCVNCGNEVVSDDWGDQTPNEVRKAILEQEGEWELVILKHGENKSRFLRKLRDALSLTLQKVSDLCKKIPGTLIAGTFQEMLLLKIRLALPDEDISINRVK
ncbi:hypothetical protein LBW89_18300 [Paenibacillus sp. alder61]|uniref:Uncharacterized protein n=1 Tax=Paenibacillus faecis TaxID=862114 RepID=A0A5D0CNE1_9BACL|nr:MULTISPECIES: hypothetical protein [Paenibacillus]MCA1294968.1 hypothetical protein [Paenibacillus sp. alder61]TYA10765.1 hypothetical protein FRY98_23585 [Paenibacillus faecis]